MTPGEAVRLIRRRNGLEQHQFAARLGVDRKTVARAEGGEVSPGFAAAVRRVFWFDPTVLADLATAADAVEHATRWSTPGT